MPKSGTPSRRATIKDVAERAGVSISTVSHVFSGERPISKETQEHVRRIAAELRYRADPSAQSLRMSRTGIIGLVVRPKDAIAGSRRGTMTFIRLMGASAATTLARGRGLVHVPDVLNPAVVQVPMDVCIVAHPYGNDEVLTELLARGTPVVTIDVDPDRRDYLWSVRQDYTTPMRILLDTAHEHGARRILYLSGTEDNAWNRDTIAEYQRWTAEHGIAPDHEAMFEGEEQRLVAELITSKLSAAQRPDAIITGPSTFASLIPGIARKLGLSVPDDVMIGTLTESEHSRATTPPITSLDLLLEEAAAQATELAIRLADGEEPPTSPVTLSPTILWRDSLPAPHLGGAPGV